MGPDITILSWAPHPARRQTNLMQAGHHQAQGWQQLQGTAPNVRLAEHASQGEASALVTTWRLALTCSLVHQIHPTKSGQTQAKATA